MIAEALLEGTRVFVRDEDGARALWQLGWFGKGTASRGRPRCTVTEGATHQQYRSARTRGRRKGSNFAEAIAADAHALEGVAERVQLGHCEAFYLAFVTCCIRITAAEESDPASSSAAVAVGAERCWRLFCAEDARFPELLAAYTHYRRLGWAPRSGVAHGVDFLLYRPGTRHTHAPFSVLVAPPQPSWARISHASRNMVSVAKSLIFCSVTFASVVDRLSPATCVASAAVYDVAISRWVPEQDRDASHVPI